MFESVKDDASPERAAIRILLGSTRPALLNVLAVLGCYLIIGPTAILAQGPTLQATVREIQEAREWIHVPVNKSVLIETNLPATRQQVLSEEIAQISSISPTQVLVRGVSLGRTQVIIWAGEQRRVFDVSVELELDQLEEAIRQVSPLARVKARPIMDTVVLSGTVPDADTADRIMAIASIFATEVQNQLQVAGEQQVILHVTVAEMSRSVLKQFGVNGILGGKNFKDFPVVSNIGAINPSSIGFGAGVVTGNLPFLSGGTVVGQNTTFSFGFPRVQMQLFLQALNENGLLRVLAEPNLVTISGRTAGFLAGGEFPIPVPQTQTAGGGNTITIEFREFGVRLAFTPVVLANHMIRLHVAPEVSELDFAQGVSFGGFVIPGLNIRRAETTVELASGQSLAIAGLLSENVRALTTRLPGLGSIPILGALFSSTEFRKNLTELVIMVSPEIVAPLNPDQIGILPGTNHQEPDDWQLFALGLLDGNIEAQEEGSFQQEADGSVWHIPGDREGASHGGILGPWGQSDLEENE